MSGEGLLLSVSSTFSAGTCVLMSTAMYLIPQLLRIEAADVCLIAVLECLVLFAILLVLSSNAGMEFVLYNTVCSSPAIIICTNSRSSVLMPQIVTLTLRVQSGQYFVS